MYHKGVYMQLENLRKLIVTNTLSFHQSRRSRQGKMPLFDMSGASLKACISYFLSNFYFFTK